MTLDLRFYLVTSGSGRHTVETAAAAARAGAGIVQVRCKRVTDRELYGLLVEVSEAVAAANPATRVVVDDRPDLAWAARNAGAPVHGVHLGADDLPPEHARALLGPGAVVGWTTGTLALVQEAQKYVGIVDYLGAGPFRPTTTKDSGRPPLGVAGYPPLVEASAIPIVAIGDVTPDDVEALATTGIAGVCMVRAVMEAEDPACVVRRSLDSWQRGTGA